MYSKKVKLRFVFVVVFLTLIALTTFSVLRVLKDNVVYFKSPSEVNLLSEISKKKIRVGGMVKKDSVMMNNNKINFIITDFKNELYVTFSGTVPNLFEEEKGVVAEGFLNDKKFLVADKILAKHDEILMKILGSEIRFFWHYVWGVQYMCNVYALYVKYMCNI